MRVWLGGKHTKKKSPKEQEEVTAQVIEHGSNGGHVLRAPLQAGTSQTASGAAVSLICPAGKGMMSEENQWLTDSCVWLIAWMKSSSRNWIIDSPCKLLPAFIDFLIFFPLCNHRGFQGWSTFMKHRRGICAVVYITAFQEMRKPSAASHLSQLFWRCWVLSARNRQPPPPPRVSLIPRRCTRFSFNSLNFATVFGPAVDCWWCARTDLCSSASGCLQAIAEDSEFSMDVGERGCSIAQAENTHTNLHHLLRDSVEIPPTRPPAQSTHTGVQPHAPSLSPPSHTHPPTPVQPPPLLTLPSRQA